MINKILRKSQFKKDFKRILKQGKSLQDFELVLDLLLEGSKLPDNMNDHLLIGNWNGCRELHIKTDWLLIYKIDDKTLSLIRTGSHSDLFD